MSADRGQVSPQPTFFALTIVMVLAILAVGTIFGEFESATPKPGTIQPAFIPVVLVPLFLVVAVPTVLRLWRDRRGQFGPHKSGFVILVLVVLLVSGMVAYEISVAHSGDIDDTGEKDPTAPGFAPTTNVGWILVIILLTAPGIGAGALYLRERIIGEGSTDG